LSFALKYLNIDFNIFFKARALLLEKSWNYVFSLFLNKLTRNPNRLPGALLKKYVSNSYKNLKIKYTINFNV
jgi:hypothetical protein